METRMDRRRCGMESGASGLGSGLLVALVALACPLLCLGPLLLAGPASTGIARVLRGAPWPPVAVAVLIVMALGIGGVHARGGWRAQDCCRPVPGRLPYDGTPH
jgi:hypothetical protein